MPPPSVVIADPWPLIRAGVAMALREAGVLVAAEVDDHVSAAEAVVNTGAVLVVVTSERPAGLVETVTALRSLEPAPKVIALVDTAGRDDLTALVEAGATGVFLRTTAPSDLAAAVPRVMAGERVLAPALVGVIVGTMAGRDVARDGSAANAADRSNLTPKELLVLRRLAAGDSNRDIGAVLFLAPATVKSHLANIYAKLEVVNRRDAIQRGVELGLV